MSKTITFIGASNGCGYHALTSALSAGHTCIALCRVPSKLADLSAQYPSALIIKQGNAHDISNVSDCLVHNGRLVDAISTSIGSTMDPKTFKFADPNVCEKGTKVLLEALANLREQKGLGLTGHPLIAAVSSTGISSAGRDIPLLFYHFYHYALATPHADKKVMEEQLMKSSERFVLIRPSLLVDGDKVGKVVKVGVEDVMAGKVEKKEIGYTISRAAMGRWMFANVLARAEGIEEEGKAVSLTW